MAEFDHDPAGASRIFLQDLEPIVSTPDGDPAGFQASLQILQPLAAP
jgi:hypothetical protein